MAEVIRLNEPHEYQIDVHDAEVDTLAYLVKDADPAAALKVPGVPLPGSEHPDRPGVFCDSIAVSVYPGSATSTLIRASYSRDRRASFGGPGRPNPAAPLYASWSVSSKIVIQDIPYAIYDPRAYVIPVPHGNDPQLVPAWTMERHQHEETRTVIRRVVNVRGFDISQFAQLALSQVNTLHVIGGTVYVFTSARIEQADDQTPPTAVIEYEWEHDAGTPSISAPPPAASRQSWPGGLFNQIPNVPISGGWTRPPYHAVSYIMLGEGPIFDPPQPPWWIAVPMYTAPNPDGYMSLPGWR